MDQKELHARIAGRTGASEKEVAAVLRELFPQAFAMAMEKPGGTLVMPHFATFRCRPKKSGGMAFAFKPRLPDQLVHAARLRGQKLAVRKAGGRGFKPRSAARLSGAAYVPASLQPPVRSGGAGKNGQKPGFLARLFGFGS